MDQRLIKNPLGFWEIKNKPTSDALHQYYAEKYYQEAKGGYEFEYTFDELQYFRTKLEQRLEVIKKYIGYNEGALLDVGCGEGHTLAFFRDLGWSVKGIDFSSAGVHSQNPDCLDLLTTGDIYKLLLEEISANHSYDVIWLQNVLEHVIDPIALLHSLRRIISSGGLAVITVPNDCSFTQIAALEHRHINNKFWIVPPDHLNYFNSESLRNVVESTGFNCVELHGDFPIDWFLFHPGSNYIHDNGVGKAAHKARVQLENMIHQQPIEDVINFWSACGKIGVGRDLTIFLSPR